MSVIDIFLNDSFYKGVVVLTGKDFQIIESNDLFLTLNGYDKNDIKKIKFIDMVVPDDKFKIMDVLYNNLVTQDVTVKLYHKTGAFRFFSFIVLTFDDKFLLIGNEIKKSYVGYDYTVLTNELKNVESIFKDLEITNLKEFFIDENPALNFLLDVLPIDVWVKDRYAKYVYVNDTFTKHTGHSRAFVKDKSDFELFDKDIANEFVNSDNKVIDSATKLNYVFESKSEKLLTWTDVTKVPIFNKNGVYVGIIGFSVDITTYKNIENKYDEEMTKLRHVLENIPGIVSEIGPSGEVLFIEGKLKGKFNLDYEYSALEFIREKQRPELQEKIRYALSSGKEVKMITTVQDIDMEFTLKRVPNNKGTYNLIAVGSEIIGDAHE